MTAFGLHQKYLQ